MSQNRGNWRFNRGRGGRPPMDRRFNRQNNWNNNNHQRNGRNSWVNNRRDYINDRGVDDHRNEPPQLMMQPSPFDGRYMDDLGFEDLRNEPSPSNGRPNTSHPDHTDR